MWREIGRFGKKLVEQGLVPSHFGNISVRVGDKILITRSGSMLDEITEKDVVEVDLYKEGSMDIIASSETISHRMIYQKTSAQAIIHTHAPYAVVQSMMSDSDRFVPIDSEGSYFLHDVPVVTGGIGSKEMAVNLSEALKERKGAIVKGHGTFATGKILEEAFVVTTMIEHSAMLKYLVECDKKGND